MPSDRETRTGIDYAHVVAGMHIGCMGMFLPDHIAAVLTVAKNPGTVPDKVAHRHQHLSYFDLDAVALDECVTWVLGQLSAERAVLIRSEGGRQRPALVAGMVILRLGGYYSDALYCLMKADPLAFSDFRYRQVLREADESINARLRAHP
jgi:hypothetical protein